MTIVNFFEKGTENIKRSTLIKLSRFFEVTVDYLIIDEETRRALLQSFGFRAVGEPALQRWRWAGLKSADKRKHNKHGRKDKKDASTAQPAAHGDRARPSGKQAKGRRGKPAGKPQPRTGQPVEPAIRPPRPDRMPRRGPSPNSPFAGLAAMLADARKD